MKIMMTHNLICETLLAAFSWSDDSPSSEDTLPADCQPDTDKINLMKEKVDISATTDVVAKNSNSPISLEDDSQREATSEDGLESGEQIFEGETNSSFARNQAEDFLEDFSNTPTKSAEQEASIKHIRRKREKSHSLGPETSRFWEEAEQHSAEAERLWVEAGRLSGEAENPMGAEDELSPLIEPEVRGISGTIV